MMKLIPLLLVFVVSCSDGSTSQSKQDNSTISKAKHVNKKCNDYFAEKTFTYLYREDVPEHLFTLQFQCVDGKIRGIIFGPEPAGEHGLFFFIAKLENIKLEGYLISFDFRQGNYYEKRITLENYADAGKWESFGGSSYEINFSGELKDNQIIFQCESEFNSCYDNQMKFIEVN